ncbi:MAG: sigma-54 dependent transcriptional regulator [Terriglobia bacterium]|jgi:two-component system nitrogen regulation response regulator GlnG
MTAAGSKVLIVDGNEQIALLSTFLEQEVITPVVAHSGQAALEKISSEHPDALVVDMKLPDMDGMQIMKGAKALDEDLPVILITGYPEIRGAVAAMRAGAHDYLAKPLKRHEVLRVVFRALNERALKRKLRRLACQIEDENSLRESMGPSNLVRRLIADVSRVAGTNFSVLILGETGSGKELVARAIHQSSPRCRASFMAVDCGAIPETLLESELFGHEKGAYTGADKQKNGKIEMAHGGTLFLDEISNMPLGSQAKLLRVLQDKTICRIGGTQAINTDVRVLAASNQDLQRLGESGAFRPDVYFRLNEFTIWVPPLRDRQEDILYLAKRFLDLTNLELQKNVKGFTQTAVDALLACDWPGNVRQLRSVIRRAVLLADDMVTEQHMRIDCVSPKLTPPGPECNQEIQDTPEEGLPLKEIMQRRIVVMEREILVHVLRETGGNKAKAARLLHIDYKTIHSKVRQYGIPIN